MPNVSSSLQSPITTGSSSPVPRCGSSPVESTDPCLECGIVPRQNSSPATFASNKKTTPTIPVSVRCASETSTRAFFQKGEKPNVLQNANSRCDTPEAFIGIKIRRTMQPSEILTALFYDETFALENHQLCELIQFINPKLPEALRLSIDEFVESRNYDDATIKSRERQYISYMRPKLLGMLKSTKQQIIATLTAARNFPFTRCNLLLPPNSALSDSTDYPVLQPGDLVFRPVPMRYSQCFNRAYGYFRRLIEIENKDGWKSGAVTNCQFGSLLISWGKSTSRENLIFDLSQEYILLSPQGAPGKFHITLYNLESTDVSIRSSHATLKQEAPLDIMPNKDPKFYDKLMQFAKSHTLNKLNMANNPRMSQLRTLAKKYMLFDVILSHTPTDPNTLYSDYLDALKSRCPNHSDELAFEDDDVRSFPAKKLGFRHDPTFAEVQTKCHEAKKHTAENLQLLLSFLDYFSLIASQIKTLKEKVNSPEQEAQIREHDVFRSIYDETLSEWPRTQTITWRLFLRSVFPKGDLICFKKTNADKSEVVYHSLEEILADPVAKDVYRQADSLVTSTLGQIESSRDAELHKAAELHKKTTFTPVGFSGA